MFWGVQLDCNRLIGDCWMCAQWLCCLFALVALAICSICSFLQKWPDADFVIYIIEQTNDGRKFNRGKLLNVGYDLAKKDGCAVVVFHDVDLLPSDELLPYYCTVPEPSKPCHIARVRRRWHQRFCMLW